jgi:hypothetical protein
MECVVKEARREQTGATLEKIRRYPSLEPYRGGMGPQRSDLIALLALAKIPTYWRAITGRAWESSAIGAALRA